MNMNWFIGKTGYSFIDVWTLVHISFWFYTGSIIWSFKWDRITSIYISLGVALAWEVFERYGEKYRPDLWLSPESWWNSYISDILTVFVGFYAVWYVLDNWRSS